MLDVSYTSRTMSVGDTREERIGPISAIMPGFNTDVAILQGEEKQPVQHNGLIFDTPRRR